MSQGQQAEKGQYQRFMELDILRGFAILFMIILHFFWDLDYFGILPLNKNSLFSQHYSTRHLLLTRWNLPGGEQQQIPQPTKKNVFPNDTTRTLDPESRDALPLSLPQCFSRTGGFSSEYFIALDAVSL